MSCSSDYAPRLRSLGFRVTPQRLAILHVLLESGSHLSPAQVFQRARRSSRGLTQPTVYRTLEFLARNGFAQPALDAQKHLVYQIAEHAHHHLICGQCGAGIEIDHDPVDQLYRALQRRSGYRLTDSHLTLFGVCPNCRSGNARA
jgi:Fe2+ or Zn2+ uptake regulation protein